MKKLNKFFAILVSLAMMATLCVCMAFAENEAVSGTELAPANAAITKELQMPVGTTTPEASFTFEFTGAPAIADKTVSFTGNEAGTVAQGTDVKKVYAWTNGTFVSPEIFDHAGRYYYTVKEKANTYNADANTESMKYSKAEYKVAIDVANKEDGTGLYIKNIAVWQTVTQDGTAIPEANQEKVDPSVPGAQDTDGNDFKFTNTYVKTAIENDDVEDPDDPDNPNPDDPWQDPNSDNDGDALFVKKEITGALGDKTKPFTFNVKVTAPSLSETTSYTAEVLDKNGNVKETLTFTSGAAAQQVQLAHNEKLVFTKLDIGATYEVDEAAAEGYTINNVNASTGTVTNNKATGYITEGDDNVVIVNKSNDDTTTPTGILISNLPYIALALVAIGGLVAYVVVRRRDENA